MKSRGASRIRLNHFHTGANSFADDLPRKCAWHLSPSRSLRPRFGLRLRLRERERLRERLRSRRFFRALPSESEPASRALTCLALRFLSVSPSSYLRDEHVAAMRRELEVKSQTRKLASHL